MTEDQMLNDIKHLVREFALETGIDEFRVRVFADSVLNKVTLLHDPIAVDEEFHARQETRS
jgi:hypothetical protein